MAKKNAEYPLPIIELPKAVELSTLRGIALSIAYQLVLKEPRSILSIDDEQYGGGATAEERAERIAAIANLLMEKTRDPLSLGPQGDSTDS
jgi:hypothetical protein